ncbi:DnaB-like helicase C-terminal domain-containing protein [Streptomyces sp. NPDC006733]|uniref:DnaB-like helicase C-terminal domain-containing protein n=1 Tax=Streptomyces sp. NPDC006733 TaxID=3155460 RepID=UPI0033EC77BD
MAAQESRPALSFGLPALDAAVRGITDGHLVLVASPPGVGGSLLAIAAARQAALEEDRTVLYAAAAGLRREDVVARVVACHAGVSYQALRAGTLTGEHADAACQAQADLSQAALYIDDGADLDAQTITDSASEPWHEWGKPLSLVVVDRLQHRHAPHIALSGPALTAAVQELARLAAQSTVTVLVVMDSADPALLAELDAEVTLTLSRLGQAVRVDITARDLGPLSAVALHSDRTRARFLPLPEHYAQRLLADDTTTTDTPQLPPPAPAADTAVPAPDAPRPPHDPSPAGQRPPAAAPTVPEPAASPAPADPPTSPPPGAWPAALAPRPHPAPAAADGAPAPAAAASSQSGAGAGTAQDDVPEEQLPDQESPVGRFEYGPFAVLDGTGRAHLPSGAVLPCPATTVAELVAWAADRPFGSPRLRPHGRDGDPLIVLADEAVQALGLPAREDPEERALPADHPVIRDLSAHGWKFPLRGGRPWFSAWPRIYQPNTGKRRSVQLAILPWGALTTGGWPVPAAPDSRSPAVPVAELVRFLSAYSERVMTPVSSTASTGQELMAALRPPTRAFRDPTSGEVGPQWLDGALHVATEAAPPEVPPEHPLARGRDERDPAQVLMEEAQGWWRMPTDAERALPYVVGLDINMAFGAAANGTHLGTCAPYLLEHPRFDKKLAGCWLADLSGLDLDPRLPSPFTPTGTRPTGPAWYDTHTLAFAAELGLTPHPLQAWVRPTPAQAAALGLSAHPPVIDPHRPTAGPVPPFGAGAYLKPWYQRLNDAYLTTLERLGAVHDDAGRPLTPAAYLAAMDAMKDPRFQAEHAADLWVLAAIKSTVKGGIGKLRERPHDPGRRSGDPHAPWKALERPLWRPDIRAAIIARSRATMHRKIHATLQATGAHPLAVNTDCIVYACADPSILGLIGHRSGFTAGPNPGHVKQEGCQPMDWYVATAAQDINPARRIKDGATDTARDGK